LPMKKRDEPCELERHMPRKGGRGEETRPEEINEDKKKKNRLFGEKEYYNISPQKERGKKKTTR